MTDATTRLDELLSDPMVQLVMARDRVDPAALRRMIEAARARAEDPAPPPAHVIVACKQWRDARA